MEANSNRLFHSKQKAGYEHQRKERNKDSTSSDSALTLNKILKNRREREFQDTNSLLLLVIVMSVDHK